MLYNLQDIVDQINEVRTEINKIIERMKTIEGRVLAINLRTQDQQGGFNPHG